MKILQYYSSLFTGRLNKHQVDQYHLVSSSGLHSWERYWNAQTHPEKDNKGDEGPGTQALWKTAEGAGVV